MVDQAVDQAKCEVSRFEVTPIMYQGVKRAVAARQGRDPGATQAQWLRDAVGRLLDQEVPGWDKP